jgi:hypothetical protein
MDANARAMTKMLLHSSTHFFLVMFNETAENLHYIYVK